jgi:hypothetical protein
MKLSYNTSAKRCGLNKIKEFDFEIQALQYFMHNLNLQGFHSSFQKYIVSYHSATVATTLTLGVSQLP